MRKETKWSRIKGSILYIKGQVIYWHKLKHSLLLYKRGINHREHTCLQNHSLHQKSKFFTLIIKSRDLILSILLVVNNTNLDLVTKLCRT